GVTSLGLNLIRLRPGQRGRIHRHERQEEVYLVCEGELTLIIDGEERPKLRRGEAVRVAPELRRQLLNRGPADCAVLALGGSGERWGSGSTATPRKPRPAAAASRTAGEFSPTPPVKASASRPSMAAAIAAIPARSRWT